MRRPSRSEGLHEAVEDQHAALSPHGEECAALRVRVSRLQGKRRRPAEARSQMIARRARILSILTVGIFIVASKPNDRSTRAYFIDSYRWHFHRRGHRVWTGARPRPN